MLIFILGLFLVSVAAICYLEAQFILSLVFATAAAIFILVNVNKQAEKPSSLIGTIGKYTIDLPEEIEITDGHDIKVNISNDTIYLSFDTTGRCTFDHYLNQ